MIMIKRLSHIGVKVNDLEETINIFEDLLGFKLWRHGIMEHPEEGMRNVKMSVGDTDIDIEVLQATDSTSHIGRSVERRGEWRGCLSPVFCYRQS
jgi:catechol 2,3-dioxygenase-like lactoylglutathione lyase family enzyme